MVAIGIKPNNSVTKGRSGLAVNCEELFIITYLLTSGGVSAMMVGPENNRFFHVCKKKQYFLMLDTLKKYQF